MIYKTLQGNKRLNNSTPQIGPSLLVVHAEITVKYGILLISERPCHLL
jgi:hypothetical protein